MKLPSSMVAREADGSRMQEPVGWLDPLATLTFVAGQTERLKLGVSVLVLGYRNIVPTAKYIATLDALSEGRLILGVGVGWMKAEFEALQVPFEGRGERGDEALAAWKALFSGGHAYEGKHVRFPDLESNPPKSEADSYLGWAQRVPAASGEPSDFPTVFMQRLRPQTIWKAYGERSGTRDGRGP